MRSTLLRAEYDHLQTTVKDIAKYGETAEEALWRIREMVTVLQAGGWRGEGSEAFFAEVEFDLYPFLRRLTEHFEDTSKALKTLTSLLDDSEDHIASLFQNQPTFGVGGSALQNFRAALDAFKKKAGDGSVRPGDGSVRQGFREFIESLTKGGLPGFNPGAFFGGGSLTLGGAGIVVGGGVLAGFRDAINNLDSNGLPGGGFGGGVPAGGGTGAGGSSAGSGQPNANNQPSGAGGVGGAAGASGGASGGGGGGGGNGLPQVLGERSMMSRLDAILKQHGVILPATTVALLQGVLTNPGLGHVEVMGTTLEARLAGDPRFQDVLSAIYNNPNDPAGYFALGEILEQHGFKGEASQAYAAFISLSGPGSPAGELVEAQSRIASLANG